MVKFAFSFYDFDNDAKRRAQECVYVPEKAFCTLDDNGECANTDGCKSGDSLGNLANGCAVGNNGKYAATGCDASYDIGGTPGCPTGDEMIAIDKFEVNAWPTANNDRFGSDGVWTENGATEPTNVIRNCAINIGSGCDNPFSTGHPVSGLCHPDGGAPPGTNGCDDYKCDTNQLEAKSVNLNMNRAQTGVSPALPVPPPDASAPPPPPALHAPPPPSLPPPAPSRLSSPPPSSSPQCFVIANSVGSPTGDFDCRYAFAPRRY